MSIRFELERMERLLLDIEKLRCPMEFSINNYKKFEGTKEDGHSCDTALWEDYTITTPWSELEKHRWLRTGFDIPEEMDGKHVEFRLTTGREGAWDATNPQLLFYLNGEIIQGVDVNHREVTVAKEAKAGEHYEVAMNLFSGSVKGDLILRTDVVVVDDIIEKFIYDFRIPVQTARLLQKKDPDNCRRILLKLQGAADALDLRQPYTERFYTSLVEADERLVTEFYSEINENAPLVSAIGHTHIDIAWLWTVAQTKEKVLRSFSTVLRLMDQYPEYKFMSSQPILYQFVKEQEPEMYEKIKERIAEGRWEVDGAMWLEADCNLTGGESLVRQILKGHKFFKEEFNKESKSLWLPDVFGYSAAIPQILKKSRIPYFMTTKIAWNQYNQLPNDTFMWKGIDGSEVFVFMPTTCDADKTLGLNVSFTDTRNTTTYTGIVNPNMTLGTYERFQNKDLTEDTLMLFGFGDGGGGPTKEMLESADRLKYGMPGIPRIEQEFEQEFFDRTYENIAHNPEMPTWNGELYFEYHRGTYTSMGKNKRNNRKSEILYGQLESLASIGEMLGVSYPKEVIQRGWDVILLNQFHDIIPGTCIEEVYKQTDIEYAEILENGSKEVERVTESIASQIQVREDSVIVFNTLGYDRDDLITVTGVTGRNIAGVKDSEGNYCEAQHVSDDSFLFYAKAIPAMGYKTFAFVEGEKAAEVKVWDGHYENAFYLAEFNEKMELTSLVEKETGKEFIKEGQCGNQLTVYEDRPMNWDNWDMDIFYKKKPYMADETSAPRVVEVGPLRMTVCTEYKFGDSIVIQNMHLYRDIPRIDFETEVEWKEHNTLLRVNFPVDVNTTRASFEIQFGNTERETTNNNSWDTAKFETCAHKWADLSDNGSGISLLNDCKYGYGVKEGNLSMTLIKAGTYPNANADIGHHKFTYSIYPHNGRWQEAKTVEMAYNLNVPTVVVVKEKAEVEKALSTKRFIQVSAANCFVEVLKKAEDGNGYILRMYENQNKTTKTEIIFGLDVKEVYECNLLEENERVVQVENNRFVDQFKPFEIKTYRIIR